MSPHLCLRGLVDTRLHDMQLCEDSINSIRDGRRRMSQFTFPAPRDRYNGAQDIKRSKLRVAGHKSYRRCILRASGVHVQIDMLNRYYRSLRLVISVLRRLQCTLPCIGNIAPFLRRPSKASSPKAHIRACHPAAVSFGWRGSAPRSRRAVRQLKVNFHPP
jgi:hypothetical protein